MKKLSDETKAKLIYSGELFLFAILFAVFGVLKLTNKMGYNPTRVLIFNWITVFGALWGIADFIWAISSKKRQKRISLIDKILILPLAIFIEIYDLISLITKPENKNFYSLMLGCAFMYVAAVYLFESIYHFYNPIPGLLEDDENKKEPGIPVENAEK